MTFDISCSFHHSSYTMLAQPERNYDAVDVSTRTFRCLSIPSTQTHQSSLVPSPPMISSKYLQKKYHLLLLPHKHSKGQKSFPTYSLPPPPSPSIMCEISMKIYIYIFVHFGIKPSSQWIASQYVSSPTN